MLEKIVFSFAAIDEKLGDCDSVALYNNGFNEKYGAGLIRYDNFINNYNSIFIKTSIINYLF